MQEQLIIRNRNASAESRPLVIRRPKNLTELRDIIQDSTINPSPIRAIGHAYSLTPCFEADNGTQLFMDCFDRITIDMANETITVGAGVSLLQIRDALTPYNMQLEVMPEIGNITAGAMACCGTKSASFKIKNDFYGLGQVNSTVLEVKLVNAAGNIEIINENTVVEGRRVNTQGEIEDTDLVSRGNDLNRLKDIRSSYGLFGIIYEVTFKIRPRQMIEISYETLTIDYSESTRTFTVPPISELIGTSDGFLAFLQPFNRKIIVENRRHVFSDEIYNIASQQLRNLTWKLLIPYIGIAIHKSDSYLSQVGLRLDKDFSNFDSIISEGFTNINRFIVYNERLVTDFENFKVELDLDSLHWLSKHYINKLVKLFKHIQYSNFFSSITHPIPNTYTKMVDTIFETQNTANSSDNIFSKIEYIFNQILKSLLKPPGFSWDIPQFDPDIVKADAQSSTFEFDLSDQEQFLDFTFWAFPESRWGQVIPNFVEFLHDYYERTGFRPTFPVEIYYIGQDQHSTLSFSAKEPIFTLNMVDIRPHDPNWKELNIQFNRMAIEYGGYPLPNQTKQLSYTPEVLAQTFGTVWTRFITRIRESDPGQRFTNNFFRILMSDQQSEFLPNQQLNKHIIDQEKKKNVQVFLSYAHEDKELGAQVRTRLEENGIQVWDAEHNITPGENWEDKIQTALQECVAMVVLLTRKALRSRWVDTELEYAFVNPSYDGRLIPIFVDTPQAHDQEEIPWNQEEIPWILRRLQMFTLTEHNQKDIMRQITQLLKRFSNDHAAHL